MSLGSSNNKNVWSGSKLENKLDAKASTMTWNSMGKSSISFARMKVLWDIT